MVSLEDKRYEQMITSQKEKTNVKRLNSLMLNYCFDKKTSVGFLIDSRPFPFVASIIHSWQTLRQQNIFLAYVLLPLLLQQKE